MYFYKEEKDFNYEALRLTGILPQIIIVDHVDGKNLECKEEFEGYIRCNWRNNTGLI